MRSGIAVAFSICGLTLDLTCFLVEFEDVIFVKVDVDEMRSISQVIQIRLIKNDSLISFNISCRTTMSVPCRPFNFSKMVRKLTQSQVGVRVEFAI